MQLNVTIATTPKAAAVACRLITLLVNLAWETPFRGEACELAEALIDALGTSPAEPAS